jgi:hypothetical protein
MPRSRDSSRAPNCWASEATPCKVGIWKQARELVIMRELKSTGPFILPAKKVTQGDTPLGLMRTLLRPRLSRMPYGRHIKDERKKDWETSLSMAAVTELGTRPSPPPRPKPHDTREPTPTQTTHATRNTRE